MYGNVGRNRNMNAIQGLVSDTVKETIERMSAPKKAKPKLLESDGGALYAYWAPILAKKK